MPYHCYTNSLLYLQTIITYSIVTFKTKNFLIVLFAQVGNGVHYVIRQCVVHHFAGFRRWWRWRRGGCSFLGGRDQLEDEIDQGEDGKGVHDGGEGGGVCRSVRRQAGAVSGRSGGPKQK